MGSTLEMLLSAESISQFSDRLEFLGNVAQTDVTLVAQARVNQEQLRRAREALSSLAEVQSATAATLQAEQARLERSLSATQDLVEELTAKLNAEQRASAEAQLYSTSGGQIASPVGNGALAVCPVQGPHSFVDTFGAPRPGGRVHEGNDIMAPRGTPVVAAQTGNAVQTPNDLGGNAMIVYAANGDYTYYAHLDSYGASGQVSAGTQIGTVGNTGDAAGGPTHLHFEYHPGGGGAVDPYPYLIQVC